MNENNEKTNAAIHKARKVLEEISQDEHERYLAELREKYIMDQIAIEGAGYDKGHKAGIKQEKLSIAKKLKEQNIDTLIISNATGLTVEEIKTLK